METSAVPTDVAVCVAVQCRSDSTTAPSPRLSEPIVTSETDLVASETAWLRPPTMAIRPGTVATPSARTGFGVAEACWCAAENEGTPAAGALVASWPGTGIGSLSAEVVPLLSALAGSGRSSGGRPGTAGTLPVLLPANVPNSPKSAVAAEACAEGPATCAVVNPMLAVTPARPT